MDIDRLYNLCLNTLSRLWAFLVPALFLFIRSTLWAYFAIGFWPQTFDWLRGIVMEMEVDWDLCIYYLQEDLMAVILYLMNLFVWSLPFVPVKRMWSTLRIDIISLVILRLITTAVYLIYVQYFSASYPL